MRKYLFIFCVLFLAATTAYSQFTFEAGGVYTFRRGGGGCGFSYSLPTHDTVHRIVPEIGISVIGIWPSDKDPKNEDVQRTMIEAGLRYRNFSIYTGTLVIGYKSGEKAGDPLINTYRMFWGVEYRYQLDDFFIYTGYTSADVKFLKLGFGLNIK